MPKDKISDYSATANSNTDIGGINIDEGCAPSGINDAIRTLMKQLKDWQSGSQDVYIHPAGSASVPSITATGDTNTGIFFPAADTVGITTGGTERARVDSSGNIGLGSAPKAWSNFKALNIGQASFGGGYANYTEVIQNAFYDGGVWKHIASASTAASQYEQNAGLHSFYSSTAQTANNTVAWTGVLSFDKDKTVSLQGATPQTGTGITFPATQSASSNAKTLDDYEEGSWTPTFTNFGTVTLSGTQRYVKIGSLVWVYVAFSCTSTPTANSSRFTLPFTPAVYSGGTWTQSTAAGGTVEAQAGTGTCYFATTAPSANGTFYCTVTFSV